MAPNHGRKRNWRKKPKKFQQQQTMLDREAQQQEPGAAVGSSAMTHGVNQGTGKSNQMHPPTATTSTTHQEAYRIEATTDNANLQLVGFPDAANPWYDQQFFPGGPDPWPNVAINVSDKVALVHPMPVRVPIFPGQTVTFLPPPYPPYDYTAFLAHGPQPARTVTKQQTANISFSEVPDSADHAAPQAYHESSLNAGPVQQAFPQHSAATNFQSGGHAWHNCSNSNALPMTVGGDRCRTETKGSSSNARPFSTPAPPPPHNRCGPEQTQSSSCINNLPIVNLPPASAYTHVLARLRSQSCTAVLTKELHPIPTQSFWLSLPARPGSDSTTGQSTEERKIVVPRLGRPGLDQVLADPILQRRYGRWLAGQVHHSLGSDRATLAVMQRMCRQAMIPEGVNERECLESLREAFVPIPAFIRGILFQRYSLSVSSSHSNAFSAYLNDNGLVFDRSVAEGSDILKLLLK